MKELKLNKLFEKPISGEWGNEPNQNELGIEVIRTTNFSYDIRLKIGSEITYRVIEESKIESKKLNYGDIIIEKSGGSPTQPVGRVLFYDYTDSVPRICNNFTAILRPITGNNPKYLAYLLNFLYQQGAVLKHQNKTTGIINLKLNNYLKDISVIIPQLETQKNIVDVLDKAQGLIDARKEQIKLMDELIKSAFYEIFGNPVKNSKEFRQVPLGELCNLKAGKFIKAEDISDLNENNMYPCFGGNGLRGYVKEYTHDGYYPLIGRQGALCGNVQFAEGKFYATEHAIVTQPTVELDIIWLYIMLREMNLNRLATGAAQPGLNVSTLMPLEVIYPAISLQTEFANKFKEIEIQKAFMKKSLIDIENNYYGLMQKAFSGKLF